MDKSTPEKWNEAIRMQFLNVPGYTRFQEGIDYYRKGKIKETFITPGRINSTVTGRHGRSYKVQITAKIPGLQLMTQKLLFLIGNHRGGGTPDFGELVQGVRGNGSLDVRTILPDVSSFKMACSCPDHAPMCKHIYAVIIAVSRLDETDPEALLTYSGLTKNVYTSILNDLHKEEVNGGNDLHAHDEAIPPVNLDMMLEDIRSGKDFFGESVAFHVPQPIDTDELKAPHVEAKINVFEGIHDWISSDMARGYNSAAKTASVILAEIRTKHKDRKDRE